MLNANWRNGLARGLKPRGLGPRIVRVRQLPDSSCLIQVYHVLGFYLVWVKPRVTSDAIINLVSYSTGCAPRSWTIPSYHGANC